MGLEPIDELRDVRLAATLALGELRERERFGREHEVPERAELGERKADLGEGAFRTGLDGAGGVEEEEGEGAFRHGAATLVGHGERYEDAPAGVNGCERAS